MGEVENLIEGILAEGREWGRLEANFRGESLTEWRDVASSASSRVRAIGKALERLGDRGVTTRITNVPEVAHALDKGLTEVEVLLRDVARGLDQVPEGEE